MTQNTHPSSGKEPAAPMTAHARRLRDGFLIVLGLLVAANFIVKPHHPHFELEAIPGFWAIFGMAVAILLARLAKGAAHGFLGKDEDFYEEKTPSAGSGSGN